MLGLTFVKFDVGRMPRLVGSPETLEEFFDATLAEGRRSRVEDNEDALFENEVNPFKFICPSAGAARSTASAEPSTNCFMPSLNRKNRPKRYARPEIQS